MNRPRLSRLDQIFIEHPVYFITACTFDRKEILNNTEIHETFCCFCKEGLKRNIFIGRYVLMPDHLHLFASFPDSPHVLSNWVKSLKNKLSQQFRLKKIPAPHWQKGFFDHVLRSQESYDKKWMYVFQNPVRAKLVSDASAWKYQGEIYPLA
jgi:putative transposase